LNTKIYSALCRIARSQNKILSAFTEAVKVTVYKKISAIGDLTFLIAGNKILSLALSNKKSTPRHAV
jgi:hypothetical protein